MPEAANQPDQPTDPLEQVFHVLDGRTADGTSQLPWKLSFTNDRPTRYASVWLGAHLLLILNHLPDKHHTEQARTALIFKLLSHLTRTGRQTVDDINDFYLEVDTAIRVLIKHPHLITSRVNFASILRREHPDRTLKLLPGAPPRNVVWTSADKAYRLEELTHPLHVLIEGLIMRSCLARQYEKEKLQTLRLVPGTPAAAPYLKYWQYIRTCHVRLYAFSGPRGARATIGFHTSPWSLFDVRGPCNTYLTSRQQHFPAVVEALTHLAATFGHFTLNNFDDPLQDDLYRALRPMHFSAGRPPLPNLPRVIAQKGHADDLSPQSS